MFKEYGILLLLGHIIGDFYAQTEEMAKKKNRSLTWLVLHCLSYGAVIFCLLLFYEPRLWGIGAAAVLSHAAIDSMKYLYNRKKKGNRSLRQERNIFFTDQTAHLVCLFLCTIIAAASGSSPIVNTEAAAVFRIIGISPQTGICWITALLLIHKPANIAIMKLLAPYRPETKAGEKENNAGRLVGTIERIIMLILIAIGEYSAVGLVLTAKSIARYDKIAKEKDFAEYYLLGTLTSTLAVIAVSFLV